MPPPDTQLCLFTLARRVPHASMESLRAQLWYTSSFAAHYVFHEESSDAMRVLRTRYPPPVQLISVRDWFAGHSGRMAAPHDPVCDASAHDRATLLRHPPAYRRMCHFFYGAVLFDFLPRTCGYALRVDGDCLLDANQPDPALSLPRAISSTRWQGMDTPHVIRGMAALFASLEWRESGGGSSSGGTGASGVNATDAAMAERWEREGWVSPYTNLMFINLTWAREQRAIIEAVDRTNCIYAARWGDLPLWGATLRLRGLKAQEQLPLSYFHGSHGTNVAAAASSSGSKGGSGQSRPPAKSGSKPPARRFGDLEWLMARAASSGSFIPQRHLLDWRYACDAATQGSEGRNHSGATRRPDATSRSDTSATGSAAWRMYVLHAAWGDPPHGFRASRPAAPKLHSQQGGAASPSDAFALETVVAQLRSDLSARGVLCNAVSPCKVELMGRSKSQQGGQSKELPGAMARLRICLPAAARSKRLCEPFGDEIWRQVGVHLSDEAEEEGACFTFDLVALVRWWAANRVRSPFLVASAEADDPRLVELVDAKRRASGEGGKPSTRIRRAEAELHATLRQAIANATMGATRDRQPTYETGLRTCAVVGSGMSLRCGGAHGATIDAAHSVFRAGPAQQFGLSNDAVGHSLRRFRLSARQAGRRTTFRVDCLFGQTVLPRDIGRDTCIVGRDWWHQKWARESVSAAVHPCCELKPMRTHYPLSRLDAMVRGGHRVRWFVGTRSSDEALDNLLQSPHDSDGEALQSALALCDSVAIYGFGRVLAVGAHDLIVGRAFEQRVGRCPSNATHLEAEDAHGRERNGRSRGRAAAWRDKVVRRELLLHILHALGMVKWNDL